MSTLTIFGMNTAQQDMFIYHVNNNVIKHSNLQVNGIYVNTVGMKGWSLSNVLTFTSDDVTLNKIASFLQTSIDNKREISLVRSEPCGVLDDSIEYVIQ